jgi:hypothetical protein
MDVLSSLLLGVLSSIVAHLLIVNAKKFAPRFRRLPFILKGYSTSLAFMWVVTIHAYYWTDIPKFGNFPIGLSVFSLFITSVGFTVVLVVFARLEESMRHRGAFPEDK